MTDILKDLRFILQFDEGKSALESTMVSLRVLREARDEIKRLRDLAGEALDLNRQMYSADEDNDSPGNMQHAILVAAVTPGLRQDQTHG